MLLKSKFLRVTFALTLLVSFSFLTFADTVRLKDGSIVKGRIIGFKDGQFVVLIGEGSRQRQMTFYSDEVATIEFDSNSAPASMNKVASAPPQSDPTPTPVAENTGPTPSKTNIKVVDGKNDSATNIKVVDGKNDSTRSTQSENIPVSSNTKTSRPSAIQINSKVMADNTSNGWTNTGWVVKKGQRIRISGTGRIALGNGRFSTPSGVSSLPDTEKLVKDKPTGGLIAVIGDDNNEFIFVGGSTEFVATRDGALFLGVNEGFLDDNSGSFDVVVEIDPMSNDGN